MPLNVSFDYNFNEMPPLADCCDNKSAIRLTSYMQNDKRRVSMPPKDCSAVEVRRLRYVVGRRKKAKVILAGINMTVPEGAIYGLLGPSGSGKTTLLKSVVGQLTPSDGWVKVFGFQPNQPGSQIPGSAIGYMPQELAVYEDFTIKETLWYFGRLYRIPDKIIRERIEFLLTFLDLPRSKRLIVSMSGGQKRRVSLASALVHSPPLLILDEPTVGVDPLLRQSIWQHLVTLTQTEKITVIVTTHYIEEARRANIVGMMRRGRLLAENAPEDLMAKHQSSSLEDVFLKLCVTDTMRRAQKFASLAGIPIQVAITGTSSATPTPEIGSKRSHGVANSTAVAAGLGGVAEATVDEKLAGVVVLSGGSQSPDEGVNTSTSHDSSASSSSSSGSSSLANGDEHCERTNTDKQRQLQLAVPAKSCLRQANGDQNAIATIKQQQQQQQSLAHGGTSGKKSRFRLSSLFRLGSQSNGGHESDISTEEESNRAELRESAERRRQSGSHFIEQLMNRYQQQEHRVPVHQLLSCDTAAQPAKRKCSSASRTTSGRLQVPKIAVHKTDSGGDSGAPSRSSSQNHSPVAAGQIEREHSAAYVNHSYEPTNGANGSFNEMALVSTTNTTQQQKQCPTAAEELAEERANELALDPELFLNPADLSTMSPGGKYDYKKQSFTEYCETIGTITWKNYIRLKRNVPLLMFQFVLPAIQVILFCICVGSDPFDVPVAVVNDEAPGESSVALSTQFLQLIDSRLVRQVNYDNLETALNSVRAGQNWGVLHIPANFTLSVHTRYASYGEGEIDNETLNHSTIKVYPDMTNRPIGQAMEVAFRRAYHDLSKSILDLMGLNPALSDPPIRMQEPIYGKIDMQNSLQYLSPGVLISISYIMAAGLTSLAFIIERRDGLYDRTLAAGVGHVQMLLSHSIVQLIVMVAQISLVVFFTFVIYRVPTKGPFIWVFLLLLLQGLAGMSFGLMVSTICTEENTAIMMILGTFYPNLLLAGVIWPIEAIPLWLRWFSYAQPQTLPTQSLRDLIVRGWDIDQRGVWSGFAVTAVWLVLFLSISCLSFKIKK